MGVTQTGMCVASGAQRELLELRVCAQHERERRARQVRLARQVERAQRHARREQQLGAGVGQPGASRKCERTGRRLRALAEATDAAGQRGHFQPLGVLQAAPQRLRLQAAGHDKRDRVPHLRLRTQAQQQLARGRARAERAKVELLQHAEKQLVGQGEQGHQVGGGLGRQTGRAQKRQTDRKRLRGVNLFRTSAIPEE